MEDWEKKYKELKEKYDAMEYQYECSKNQVAYFIETFAKLRNRITELENGTVN